MEPSKAFLLNRKSAKECGTRLNGQRLIVIHPKTQTQHLLNASMEYSHPGTVAVNWLLSK